MTDYLLTGLVDFDFVSESMLPDLYQESSTGFRIGEMTYETVLIPGCVTLRRTTVECLKRFHERGGRVIFVGACPRYMDLEESSELSNLYSACTHVGFEREAILEELSDVRDVKILDNTGYAPRSYLYTMNNDGDNCWLFLCRVHAQRPLKTTTRQGFLSSGINTFICDAPKRETIRLFIRGSWKPILYDTMTGETREVPYIHEGGQTVLHYDMWYHDSLLLKLVPSDVISLHSAPCVQRKPDAVIDFKDTVAFTLEGDNVYLLDRAEYCLDYGEWRAEEEILRLDSQIRHELGMPDRLTGFAQLWTVKPETPEHVLRLRFTIPSECAVKDVRLALEDSEHIRIYLNGREISSEPDGFFVDKAIDTVPLGILAKGINILELEVPVGTRTNTEWCWLLGNFRVKVEGCRKTLTAACRKIGFGPLAQQGFPFYGGNVRYETEIETKACDLVIRASLYRGALIKVWVDDIDCGNIFMAPYEVKVPGLIAGKHTVVFEYFGNLHNTFGSMHNCSADTWYGPNHWYSEGNGWMYEYRLKDTGILASPVISIYNQGTVK